MAASLSGFWVVGSLQTDLLGNAVIALLCLLGLFGLAATWIWTMRWRSLDQASPWRFLLGPRPTGSIALSAWKWGRRAWLAWLAMLLCLFVFTLT